jgi:hypothetical protein
LIDDQRLPFLMALTLSTCRKEELPEAARLLEGKWTWTKTYTSRYTHNGIYTYVYANAHANDYHSLDFHRDGYLFMMDNGVEKRVRYKGDATCV